MILIWRMEKRYLKKIFCGGEGSGQKKKKKKLGGGGGGGRIISSYTVSHRHKSAIV